MSDTDHHREDRLDRAVAYRIHLTDRLLLTHLARFLAVADHGLTPESWFVLARVAEEGSVRQVDLTEPALVDAPNVSRLSDRLVAAGLVERRPDPDDGRARVLVATEEGRRVTAELKRRAIDERRRVFAGLDDDELATFLATLDRVQANVRGLLAPDAAP